MFLENYFKLLKMLYSSQQLAATVTVKDTSGADVSDGPYSSMTSSVCYSLNLALISWLGKVGSMSGISNNSTAYYANTGTADLAAYSGVIIGDGDAAPVITDYKLSGNQITDFSATSAISSSITDGNLVVIGTYNITNTGASPFTIKEIGVSKANKTGSARILLTRDLLATPVTIAPGDTGVVTYKIEIS